VQNFWPGVLEYAFVGGTCAGDLLQSAVDAPSRPAAPQVGLTVLRFHQMAFQTIRRNPVRDQPHAMGVPRADLDLPGLPVWLEGRTVRIAAVKQPCRTLTQGREQSTCRRLGFSTEPHIPRASYRSGRLHLHRCSEAHASSPAPAKNRSLDTVPHPILPRALEVTRDRCVPP
jgi:hypothetical protein